MVLVVAIHGFLGQSSDFSFLEDSLRSTRDDVRIWAPELFAPESPWQPQGRSLDSWAQSVNHYLSNEYSGFQKVVVGYSLGGRLALQLVLAQPQMWKGSLFISSNLLPISTEDCESRKYWDKKWADRFRSENWDSVVQSWNELPLFSRDGTSMTPRFEEDFARESLAEALENWSPVHQKVLSRSQLNQFQNSHSVVGLDDQKYLAIQERLGELNSTLSLHQVEGGHRLLNEQSAWIRHKAISLIEAAQSPIPQ